jgi:hypothetical protein
MEKANHSEQGKTIPEILEKSQFLLLKIGSV